MLVENPTYQRYEKSVTTEAGTITTYVWEADPGTPTSAKKWRIKRIVKTPVAVESGTSYFLEEKYPVGASWSPSTRFEFSPLDVDSLNFSYSDDTAKPVALSAVIQSNGSNPSAARAGDQISLVVTFNELVTSMTGTILGKAASTFADPANKKRWTAFVNVTELDADGPAAFSFVATDIAGRAGNAITSTSDGSSVTVDNTVPEFLSASYSSADVDVLVPVESSFGYVSFTDGSAEDGYQKTLVMEGDRSADILQALSFIRNGALVALETYEQLSNVVVEYVVGTDQTTLSFQVGNVATLRLLITDTVSGGHTVILQASEPAGLEYVFNQTGGYSVTETGAPETSYAVNAAYLAPDITKVVLSIADPSASLASGLDVDYDSSSGIAADATGNAFWDFSYAILPPPAYLSIDPGYLSISAPGNPIPDVFTATYSVSSPLASVEVTAEEGLEVSAVSVSGTDTITFTTVTYAGAQYDVTIKVTDTSGNVTEHVIQLENL